MSNEVKYAAHTMIESLAPPPPKLTSREVRAPIDWAGAIFALPKLLNLPKGDGRPVLLAPGFMTDEWAMRPLQKFLCRLGYAAAGWGLGKNRGDVEEDIVRLGDQCRAVAVEHGEPVTLIGWSLGGVVCREVARLYPEAVREVITLGTPVSGGPKYTVAAVPYAKSRNLDLDAFELEVLARNRIGFPQPVTAIFSRQDGVVGWRATLDVYNPQARHIEVDSTHFGIGVHRDSWRAIALILAGQEAGLEFVNLEDLL